MRAWRAGWVLATGASGLLLGLASTAWACTVQAPLIGVSPASGQPASTVTVRGQGVPRAADGSPEPVEIRWNAVTGPKLAEVMADSTGLFTTTVAIPASAPEIYSVVAVAGGARLGQTTFEVSPPPGQAAPATEPTGQLWGRNGETPRPQDHHRAGPSLAPGAGVLGGGLVAVAGGFAAASLRQRRRVARPAGDGSAT